MKNKKGFTLIELLAVVIILGILMVIAVPAVSQYIDGSRKSSYVSTAKRLAGGARNVVNSGKYDFTDPDTTYYMDTSCIYAENDFESPYAEFDNAYVAVTFNNDHYDYYWTSVDKAGVGFKGLTEIDKLDTDMIETNLTGNDVLPNVGVGDRGKIVTILGPGCTKSEPVDVDFSMNSNGEINVACPQPTATIYWALQDTNSDSNYDKLIISNSEVTGGQSGSFAGDHDFGWWNGPDWSNNDLSNVSTIEIVGKVVPSSLHYWFANIGYNVSNLNLNLSSLNVCRVSDFYSTFSSTGGNSTSLNINITGWGTSRATNMNSMFRSAGSNASTWTIQGLGSLKVSNVTDMGYIFDSAAQNVSNFSLNLSSWKTSSVTDLMYAFSGLGRYSSSFTLNLTGWDTSKVTSLYRTFNSTGYDASSVSLLGIENWNTSRVTNMEETFANYAYNASSFNLNLSKWNTSNVTSMYHTFYNSGETGSTYNVDISTWNFSNVEGMYNMFGYSAWGATNCTIKVPKTNGNGVENTTSRIYGKDSSVYSSKPENQVFTLAE